MLHGPCPDELTLLHYLRGSLAETAVPPLRQHLAACSACEELVSHGSRLDLANSAAVFDARLRAALAEESRPPEPTAAPYRRPPEQIDEYRIGELLGAGAMGQVYAGRDLRLDRKVAIKFVTHLSPTNRERFFWEARALARLEHPNVVMVYRVGVFEGAPYLVSEFVAGRSLAQLAAPLPWAQVLSIGLGLARGLSAAHARDILHRDVKPANAILRDDGQIKLLDFGLAKVLPAPAVSPAAAAVDLTQTGALIGTPLYLAPEQWRGEEATRQTDLYALGAVLYELCAGHAPHHQARDRAALEAACLHAPIPGLRGVPASLERAVLRCLRREPTERPASAQELVALLERVRAPRRWPPIAALVAGAAALTVAPWGRGGGPQRLASPDLGVALTRAEPVPPRPVALAPVLPPAAPAVKAAEPPRRRTPSVRRSAPAADDAAVAVAPERPDLRSAAPRDMAGPLHIDYQRLLVE